MAVKEFLPRNIVSRETGSQKVTLHSEDDLTIYQYGIDLFLREARTLARFRHENIVRVHGFFEENNTAYLVMDYLEGLSLDELIRVRGGRLPEKEALGIMEKILGGLHAVHEQGFLHRDIKPQNIYLVGSKEPHVPILIDFGSARMSMGERTSNLTVMLTPGYAPTNTCLQKSAPRDADRHLRLRATLMP
ncbi:MAG: serine/threonine protein kinase [Marinilabiliales bacterium]|nr:serine/threonine protein kinase [Marinilabiliales bacterium]